MLLGNAEFNASQDYLFADHLHPGPQVHTIIAQYIQSIIAAPVQATYLNQSVQSMAQGSRDTLDSRYQQLRRGENPVGSLGMFGGYSGDINVMIIMRPTGTVIIII